MHTVVAFDTTVEQLRAGYSIRKIRYHVVQLYVELDHELGATQADAQVRSLNSSRTRQQRAGAHSTIMGDFWSLRLRRSREVRA